MKPKPLRIENHSSTHLLDSNYESQATLTMNGIAIDLGGNDDEDLDVVEVDPTTEESALSHKRGSETMNSQFSTFTRYASADSMTDATLESPDRGDRTPNAMSSFLSNIGRAWGSPHSEDGLRRKESLLDGSPSSIIANKIYSPPNRRRYPRSSTNEIKESLDKSIFSAIDGADARDFQQFLDDDGGMCHRLPVLCLVEYGCRGTYASDLWVLLHNTIRRELFDIFEILNILRRAFLSLTLNDIYHIRKWWRFYTLLWAEYATYEQKHLDPLIQQICLVDGRGDMLKKRLVPLRQTREWLALKMEEITSYVEEFEQLPPGRALCLFCKTVESYADRVMTYFLGQERLLPPFIENYHGEEVKLAIESKLVEHLREGAHFPELLIALTRWMGASPDLTSCKSQSRSRDRWLQSHLFWYERRNLNSYKQRYQSSHGSILSFFQNRLKSCDSL